MRRQHVAVCGLFDQLVGINLKQEAFCDRLDLKGFHRVEIPAQHEEFSLPLPRKRKRIPLVKTISA